MHDLCVVGDDPTLSVVIELCEGDIVVPETFCYCKTQGIGTQGDVCDNTNDILTPKCVASGPGCSGSGTECTITEPGCACAGVIAAIGQKCSALLANPQVHLCEPSTMVLSETCKCGAEDASPLNKNEFCPKSGGDKLEPCGTGEIMAMNCVCGDLEGFIGQTCDAGSVLHCQVGVSVPSKSCMCNGIDAASGT